MSNLTEAATWTAGIYQLERLDQWDAGVAGAGVANLRETQLANRTLYLKTEIEKRWTREHFQIAWTNQTIAPSTVINAKGTAWSLAFPLTDWDYATPNDGITRDYIVTLAFTAGANFTYSSSAAVSLELIKTTAGPTAVSLLAVQCYQPGVSVMIQKKISIGPNEKVIGRFNVGAISASVNISNALFRIEAVIV